MDMPPEMAERVSARMAKRIHALIGCAWGDAIKTHPDDEPCTERAVTIIVLHDPHRHTPTVMVKLCAKHAELVNTLTDPHPTEEN